MARSLAPDVNQQEILDLAAALAPSIPVDWRALAAITALAADTSSGNAQRASRHVNVLAVSGGQGAGKSTLANAICSAYGLLNQTSAACSIDDFYLRKVERQTLAREVHPLLATRGVPGTHDVPLAAQTLDALAAGQAVSIPRFDKGLDDRLEESQAIETQQVDRVVFEGWCLGAAPVDTNALLTPLNDLEAEEDPQQVWRRYVNDALVDYLALWERVDFWIFLAVPDLAAVLRWRTQQEQSLPAERRMSAAAIERFVAHYERLTRILLEQMRTKADWVIDLAADHTVAAVTTNR